MQQVKNLQENQSYESQVHLTQEYWDKLKWWLNNLRPNKKKPISIHAPDLIMQSDAAKLGSWGAHCQDLVTGGQWNKEEKEVHMNFLELKAVKLAPMTFTKLKEAKTVCLQMDVM